MDDVVRSRSIPGRALQDGAVTRRVLARHSVGRDELRPDVVDSLRLAPRAVTNVHLAPEVVEAISGGFPASLTVEAYAVPVDGQPVEFTDVVDDGVRRQQLVAWDGPDDEVVWPAGGTVQVYVEGTLDVAVQDGLVEVLLDGEPVWSSSTPDYDEGS